MLVREDDGAVGMGGSQLLSCATFDLQQALESPACSWPCPLKVFSQFWAQEQSN